MKNYTSIPLIFILALALLFASCSKDTTESDRPKTELITQGNWKFSKAVVSLINISSSLPGCQTDNILSFQTNGNGGVDEGATKCDPGDPQNNSFTWNFTDNESTLHISTILFTGGSSDFTLVSLSETKLVVSQHITTGSINQKVTVTFVH